LSAAGYRAPQRILIVEDQSDTAEPLKRLLVLDGHQVRIAATLAEARVFCHAESFDLILCDIGLPDGNGVDLAREFAAICPDTKFIALTGLDSPQDQEAIAAAGFHAHFVKPFDLDSLKACFP
jgi:DNA-binding response OmpR family regulator